MKHNQRIGKWGEEKASEYLTQTRCDVIYSKVWTPYGEIDFIARRGATTLFLEVNRRTSNTMMGLPEESITSKNVSTRSPLPNILHGRR